MEQDTSGVVMHFGLQRAITHLGRVVSEMPLPLHMRERERAIEEPPEPYMTFLRNGETSMCLLVPYY